MHNKIWGTSDGNCNNEAENYVKKFFIRKQGNIIGEKILFFTLYKLPKKNAYVSE